ncbi:MAG: delta-class carbonic anhydrase [Pseudomonadales bacterium]
MNKALRLATFSALLPATFAVSAAEPEPAGAMLTLAERRAALEAKALGFGPQGPRDIDNREGRNRQIFSFSPPRETMNLCNIHLHEGAEHKGGEFTTFIGPGDGAGNNSGFRYDGTLTPEELRPLGRAVGQTAEGSLEAGDTVEIHFVFSSSAVAPGRDLAACSNPMIMNPQLRGEALIAVLVNDSAAAQMTQIAEIKTIDGYYQTPNLPDNLGDPVTYAGSTTGPTYNSNPSSLEMTWNVRPQVLKLDITSVEAWLKDNPFEETHAHGVRDLIVNPDLLAPIP